MADLLRTRPNGPARLAELLAADDGPAAAAAVAAIATGALLRVALHLGLPEGYDGLDTMIPPVASLIVFVAVALATQNSSPPRPEALEYVPSDEELVSGTY